MAYENKVSSISMNIVEVKVVTSDGAAIYNTMANAAKQIGHRKKHTEDEVSTINNVNENDEKAT